MENFSEIMDEVEKGQKIIYNNNKVTYREKGYIKNNDRGSFMLTIVYGDEPKCIYNTNVYFKNTYESEWMESSLAKEMIKDIDKSEVVSSECIVSPVLGQIPPERLSGGVKTLLLILNEPDKIFNASTCGDNCAKWILEIGKRIDVTINLRHMMSFGKDTQFDIEVQNGGEIVHSMRELLPLASKYLNKMKQE